MFIDTGFDSVSTKFIAWWLDSISITFTSVDVMSVCSTVAWLLGICSCLIGANVTGFCGGCDFLSVPLGFCFLWFGVAFQLLAGFLFGFFASFFFHVWFSGFSSE